MVGSLTSIDPAIQPMSIPPSSTTVGKRVSRTSTSLLPATITGMLIATPRATSAMCPFSSYRQYVIQRHNHIGNGDGDRGAPQAARAANLALFFLIPDQLDANPQQEQRADYFQPRQRQEIQSDRQQQNARRMAPRYR